MKAPRYLHRICLLCLCILSGCTSVGPDYNQKQATLVPNAPQTWQETLPHGGDPQALKDWWAQFNDPLLTELIEAAQTQSASIATAALRIAQARALNISANAQAVPNVTGAASSTRGTLILGEPILIDTTSQAQLQASWEIDLFGGVRRRSESTLAKLDAEIANWHSARISVAAEGDFWQRKTGDAPAAIKAAAKTVEAVYVTPFVAHATMEPMGCVVKMGGGRAEAWVPTQNAEASIAALSEASGLKLDQCDVHTVDLGGGLGRRGGTQDFVHQAVAIAKQYPDTPIKLTWSREEDMTHDFYRPTSMAKMSAGLNDKGELVALHARVSGQSINAWLAPTAIKNNKDVRQLQGWYEEPGDAQLGYSVPNLLTEYVMRNTHVPVGPWRGVNTNQNGIYMECFIEECARAGGRDSLEFRREMMKNHPKHLAVLNAVAEKGNWGKPLPAGVHRGIAQFMGYGSYSAATAEVSVSPSGQVKVHRMVFALNSGNQVNPSQVKAQIEGSVVMALSATFNEEITIENGAVKELNYHAYPVAKLKDTPKVECVLVPTHDFWGGVGEPTICVVGPAVLNAIFAATGKPHRELPLRKHGLTLA